MTVSRARVGVVNTPVICERFITEWVRDAPEDVHLAVHTLGVEGFRGYAERDLRDQVMAAARLLGSRNVDCATILGTPFPKAAGPEGETETLSALESELGVPVFTSKSAGVAALKALGFGNVAIVAPHPDGLLAAIGDYVAQQGFTVRTTGVRLTDQRVESFRELDLITRDVVYRHVRRAMREWPQAEVIYIPGGQMPVPSIPALEGDFGVPVVTATNAVLWTACDRLRVHGHHFAGRGRLLERLVPVA